MKHPSEIYAGIGSVFLPEDSSKMMTRRDGQPVVGGGMAGGERFYGGIKAAVWIFFSILISLALARLA